MSFQFIQPEKPTGDSSQESARAIEAIKARHNRPVNEQQLEVGGTLEYSFRDPLSQSTIEITADAHECSVDIVLADGTSINYRLDIATEQTSEHLGENYEMAIANSGHRLDIQSSPITDDFLAPDSKSTVYFSSSDSRTIVGIKRTMPEESELQFVLKGSHNINDLTMPK